MCNESIVCRVRNIVGDDMAAEFVEVIAQELEEQFREEASRLLGLTLLSVLRTVGVTEMTLDAATSTDVLMDDRLGNVKLVMENLSDGSLYLKAERIANNNPEDGLDNILKMMGF